MNPFKPTRTFEAVVRELVSGLEDGTIVLSEVAEMRGEADKDRGDHPDNSPQSASNFVYREDEHEPRQLPL